MLYLLRIWCNWNVKITKADMCYWSRRSNLWVDIAEIMLKLLIKILFCFYFSRKQTEVEIIFDRFKKYSAFKMPSFRLKDWKMGRFCEGIFTNQAVLVIHILVKVLLTRKINLYRLMWISQSIRCSSNMGNAVVCRSNRSVGTNMCMHVCIYSSNGHVQSL